MGKRTKGYLTPTEVADLLMVSPVTVRQWARKGLLKAKATPGGHRRYQREEVAEFARRHGIELPAEGDDGRLRVLVVDDDAPFARYLVEILGQLDEPAEVRVAENGFVAGTQVHQFRPNVVILDLLIPGLDGFEVCRRLKADPELTGVRVIALTGFATPENVERILEAGAEACLRKPLRPDELLAAIGLRPAGGARPAVAGA